MDEVNDLPEVQYRERQRKLARDLGFVRLLPINKETYPIALFDELWEKIHKADYAFDDSSKEDKELFAINMCAPGTYNFEIPGEVFAQLTFAAPGSNAYIHFISLSVGPTAPLKEAAAELFWFAFEKIEVQRVTGYIPEFNKKVIRMATLMMMKFEGVMRKAFLYNKEYWDVHLYGLLVTEYKRRDNASRIYTN